MAKIGTWEVSSEDELIWSDETHDLFGVDRSDFGGTIEEFHRIVHPEDVERVRRVADFSDTLNTHFNSEYRIVRPDGALRHMRQTAIVLRDARGNPLGFSGVVQDVSEQVETEAQLRQAQKMEAIGQLSGGVAHDFNNILAAIMSAAELLQMEDDYDPDLVESIINSAKRGGELTNRLLSFARKQPLRKTCVDAVPLIRGMAPMLDRLIGPDITLDLALSDQVWRLEADPAPLQEALLNLVVNARDAIDSAGKITLSCRNASVPGPMGDCRDYVEINVIDTGSGMSEEVRQQARDPFFTTKPVGQGSGLGLSMVDGYVRQSGGQIHIHSGLGKGTRVALLLPRSEHTAPDPAPRRTRANQGNGERVLVIEDNVDLARLIQRQLSSLNYRPTLAANRRDALQAAAQAGGFDIVLSDILLANGERGPAVVEELLALYPDMKTVFMTGFASDDQTTPHAFGEPKVVLSKPFKIEELAKALR